jgi:hypothetical protein
MCATLQEVIPFMFYGNLRCSHEPALWGEACGVFIEHWQSNHLMPINLW